MSKKHFTWNGEMRLGPRIGHTWYGFDDLHHPLVQANIKEVKDNKYILMWFILNCYLMSTI